MTTNELPILEQFLNEMEECERRRILRSHLEVGIAEVDDIVIRRRLDAKLDEIAQLELRAEASDPDAEEALRKIPAFAELVQTSPAFFQYLNLYLYFSVRFAAGRNPVKAAAAPVHPYPDQLKNAALISSGPGVSDTT